MPRQYEKNNVVKACKSDLVVNPKLNYELEEEHVAFKIPEYLIRV